MAEEIAIKVENVSKNFVLPHEKVSSVKGLFTGLTKNRNKTKEVQHALRDISFEIKKGEFFGIVGRNGSGKSTMLKILAGIYQPTNGKVYTRGKLVPFIELGVGFNPELSGRDNVYLNGAMLGFSEKEIDSMYDDIVKFAELEQFMDQKLKNYSSGMQVRLAFSMATRSEADILLIDEVLAVGDADFQRKCYDYFKQLKKNKKTVVFVSHDMDAVKEFCDRAALIEKNRIKDVGDAVKIAEEYSDLFLEDKNNEDGLNDLQTGRRTGTGAVRITNATLEKGSYTDMDQVIDLRILAEGRKQNSEVAVGFAIKNAQGQYINGAHTWGANKRLPELSEGSVCEVVWGCPNVYEDGLYTIDVYVYGDHMEVYDRIEDAVTFRVKRRTRSGCILTIPVDVEMAVIEKGKEKQEL